MLYFAPSNLHAPFLKYIDSLQASFVVLNVCWKYFGQGGLTQTIPPVTPQTSPAKVIVLLGQLYFVAQPGKKNGSDMAARVIKKRFCNFMSLFAHNVARNGSKDALAFLES